MPRLILTIILICALAIIQTGAVPAKAGIIYVPTNQPTIQAGINTAVNGDTVLVEPGTYLENVNFRSKGITVASRFLLTGNMAYVDSTVIDGSAPVHPDTASCVIIAGSNPATATDTLAALIGFLIMNGAGTKWLDEHGAGVYREGGGVLTQYLSPRIRYNKIVRNQAVNISGLPAGHAGGGGLRCGDGLPRIENNRITYNSGLYGGGIVLNFTGAILKNNVIAYDTAGSAYFAGGGVWINGNYSGSSAQIINNTIAYNYASTVGSTAGGIAIFAGTPNVRNDIITNNTGMFQIYSQTFLWVYFCNVQGGYAGQGNINADPLFIGGPSGGFYLSQIAAGQIVNSPCVNAGDTLSAMIMGTTRNDGVQDAGIVDMGYHYPLPFPAIDVTMTPIAPPIVLPANGGSFQFNACVRRTTGPPAPFYAWARDRNPNGTYSTILLGPVQINPPVGVQVQRLRTQVVAASWQTGLHHYVGYAHTSVSYPATDTDSFSWTKSATADGGPWIEKAACSGELFPDEEVVSSSHRDSFEQPSAFRLTSISPNPFNSMTTIRYEIPGAFQVELNIYNLRGEIIRNFSRNNPGGSGSFTWDGTDRNGSPVGSGIYLCRLKGGNNTATQRIVLLK